MWYEGVVADGNSKVGGAANLDQAEEVLQAPIYIFHALMCTPSRLFA